MKKIIILFMLGIMNISFNLLAQENDSLLAIKIINNNLNPVEYISVEDLNIPLLEYLKDENIKLGRIDNYSKFLAGSLNANNFKIANYLIKYHDYKFPVSPLAPLKNIKFAYNLPEEKKKEALELVNTILKTQKIDLTSIESFPPHYFIGEVIDFLPQNASKEEIKLLRYYLYKLLEAGAVVTKEKMENVKETIKDAKEKEEYEKIYNLLQIYYDKQQSEKNEIQKEIKEESKPPITSIQYWL